MTNDEIKARTFELIDSRREEIISFLGDYIRHRSINPEREIPEVERGGDHRLSAMAIRSSQIAELFRDSDFMAG
jgi:hypothetical protein